MFENETTLFDFDFEPVVFSEDEINEAFALLVQRVKQRGNYYTFNGIEIEDIKKYFHIFSERGWIKKGSINDDLRDYHSIDEVVEQVQEYFDNLLSKPHESINYLNDVLHAAGKIMPLMFHPNVAISQRIKRKCYNETIKIEKEVALTLGLKHYVESAVSRGSALDAFSHKGYKQHLIPYLKKKIVEINDFDEMEKFFKNAFLVGRRDELWNSYGTKVVPYPVYEGLSLNRLAIAALTQTSESNVDEVLKLVLKHSGKFSLSKDSTKNIIYLPTFSEEQYFDSLSASDLELILEDMERLNRIHKQIHGKSA